MKPVVAVVMGSPSDWPVMAHAARTLTTLGVTHERRVVSAHRSPDLLYEFAKGAQQRGLRAIIAGASGAAHLPGMLAALTTVPVLGVPTKAVYFNGLDSLLSIVQMPRGVDVATFGVGAAGAINAALHAARWLAHDYPAIAAALGAYLARQTRESENAQIPQITEEQP